MEEKKSREKSRLSTGSYPQGGATAHADLAGLPLPEDVCPEAWAAYLDMRVQRRAPLTRRAAMLVVKRLMALRAEGYCPTAALEKSARCGWLDVYPGERMRQPEPVLPPTTHQGVPMPEAVRARLATLRQRAAG